MSKYKAVKNQISNRGVVPDAFMDKIVEVLQTLPREVFSRNPADDVYTAVAKQLGPYHDDDDYRRAVMAVVLYVLAGFESSWNWKEGKHAKNKSADQRTWEAGAWQVSQNSTYRRPGLVLVLQKYGIDPTDPVAFQGAMKSIPALAIEYVARLLRYTVEANGPVLRDEIDPYLSREAVNELQGMFKPFPKVTAPPIKPPVKVTFDERSERNIATLLPKAQAKAREFLRLVRAENINAVIICGTRTYAEQSELYAQGRTKPGNIVTYAKAGYSYHNFGIAWDFMVSQGGKALFDGKEVRRAGEIAESIGLDWGGRWKMADTPHVQLKTGLTMEEMRARVGAGRSVV